MSNKQNTLYITTTSNEKVCGKCPHINRFYEQQCRMFESKINGRWKDNEFQYIPCQKCLNHTV